MPERFELRRFDSDLNQIKRSLTPQQQSVINRIQAQVVDLNSDLKASQEEVKQKNIQLRQNNETITKLTKDFQAKDKEYNDALKKNAALKKERDNFEKENLTLKQSRSALEAEVGKKDAKIGQLNSGLQAKNNEYEVLKTERDNLAKEISQLKQNRDALVVEVGKKDAKIEQLNSNLQNKIKEIDEASKAILAYKTEVAHLTSEYTKMKELYDGIQAQKQRPVATPTQLSSAFRDAMEAMRKEVTMLEDSPVDYVVSKFDISLKTGIGTDKEGKVSFRLPKEEEITNPENLSTIQFSIKSVPKVRK